MPNTIIFKLKEKNRNFARLNEIDNVSINNTLSDMGVYGVKKIFADAVKPVTDVSPSGEKYADLSLIYICKLQFEFKHRRSS